MAARKNGGSSASAVGSTSRRGTRSSRWLGIVALLLAAAVVYGGVLLCRNPSSRLWNEEQDLDLLSGRARFTHHLLGVPVWQEVRDTPLSTALGRGGVPGVPEDDWVQVNSFGPFAHSSPNTVFHPVLWQAEDLERIWDAGRFDAASRNKSAAQLLAVWQKAGYGHAGNSYLSLLRNLVTAHANQASMTATDLPDDMVDRALRDADAEGQVQGLGR